MGMVYGPPPPGYAHPHPQQMVAPFVNSYGPPPQTQPPMGHVAAPIPIPVASAVAKSVVAVAATAMEHSEQTQTDETETAKKRKRKKNSKKKKKISKKRKGKSRKRKNGKSSVGVQSPSLSLGSPSPPARLNGNVSGEVLSARNAMAVEPVLPPDISPYSPSPEEHTEAMVVTSDIIDISTKTTTKPNSDAQSVEMVRTHSKNSRRSKKRKKEKERERERVRRAREMEKEKKLKAKAKAKVRAKEEERAFGVIFEAVSIEFRQYKAQFADEAEKYRSTVKKCAVRVQSRFREKQKRYTVKTAKLFLEAQRNKSYMEKLVKKYVSQHETKAASKTTSETPTDTNTAVSPSASTDGTKQDETDVAVADSASVVSEVTPPTGEGDDKQVIADGQNRDSNADELVSVVPAVSGENDSGVETCIGDGNGNATDTPTAVIAEAAAVDASASAETADDFASK